MIDISNDSVTVSLPERFHDEHAVNIGLKLEAELPAKGRIILDFSNVQYIDSTGVTVLLATNKALSAKAVKLILRGMNAEVRNFFSLTYLDRLFTIE